MTHTKTLNRIDAIHSLTCQSFIILGNAIFVAFILQPILYFIDNSKNITVDLLIVWVVGSIVLSVMFLFVRDTIIMAYLRYRELDYDERRINTAKVAKIIAFILHSRDINFQGTDISTVYFTCDLQNAVNTKAFLTKIAFRHNKIPDISLTREESSMLILALSPKGGSWAVSLRATINLYIPIPALSAHERMRMHQENQKMPKSAFSLLTH